MSARPGQAQDRRAQMALAAAGAAILVAVSIAAPRLDPYAMRLVVLMAVNVILAVSLNLIAGFTGQLNLGHAGFMAAGAYLSAGLTFYYGAPAQAALARAGMPAAAGGGLVFAGALLLGGGAAAILGLLVGLPTLRLRGDYLAIATLGFGEIIRTIIVQLEVVGAARGLVGIPRHTGLLWACGWAALAVVVVRNLMTSAHGRALASVREDETAAQVMGIDTVRYKVVAFVIGAFFAGVAGALLAHYLMYLNPAMFSFLRSIEILLMVVLGGMGSIAGSAVGAVILTILPEALRTLAGAVTVGYAGSLVLLLGPYLRAPTAERRRGGGRAVREPRVLRLLQKIAPKAAAGALLLAAVMVVGVLLSAVELGTPDGARWIGWLGMAALALGLAAVLARARAAGGGYAAALALAAAGALVAVLFLRPEMLPAAAGAARDWLRVNVNQLRMVIYSVLLILLMLLRPQGLLGRAELTWRALRALMPAGRRRGAART